MTTMEVIIACVYKEFGLVQAIKAFREINKGLSLVDARAIVLARFPNETELHRDIENHREEYSERVKNAANPTLDPHSFIW